MLRTGPHGNAASATGQGSIAIAGDNNFINLGELDAPAIVRGHDAAIRALLPHDGVSGRASEIAQLRAFIADAEAPHGQWWGWYGDPWSGKTALMASIACRPTYASVTIAPFFVVGNDSTSNSGASFLSLTIPRLATIAGLDSITLPPNITIQRAMFGELVQRAADRLGPASRLVILIDGLDEDLANDQTDAPSIVNMLPTELPSNVRVLVSARNPSLTRVANSHPLNATSCWHKLDASESGGINRMAAQAEMAALLRDPLAREIAGLIAAARTPLSARDIGAITGVDNITISQLMSRRAGRSFRAMPPRLPGLPRRYGFAHAELLGQFLRVAADDARNGERPTRTPIEVLSPWEARIRDWARQQCRMGWPTRSDFLLTEAYVQFLRRAGGSQREIVETLTDTQRTDRLLSAGGSAAGSEALTEAISIANDHRPQPVGESLLDVARLALTSFRMRRRNQSIPDALPQLGYLAGFRERACALADDIADPAARCHAYALLRVAALNAEAGSMIVGHCEEGARLSVARIGDASRRATTLFRESEILRDAGYKAEAIVILEEVVAETNLGLWVQPPPANISKSYATRLTDESCARIRALLRLKEAAMALETSHSAQLRLSGMDGKWARDLHVNLLAQAWCREGYDREARRIALNSGQDEYALMDLIDIELEQGRFAAARRSARKCPSRLKDVALKAAAAGDIEEVNRTLRATRGTDAFAAGAELVAFFVDKGDVNSALGAAVWVRRHLISQTDPYGTARLEDPREILRVGTCLAKIGARSMVRSLIDFLKNNGAAPSLVARLQIMAGNQNQAIEIVHSVVTHLEPEAISPAIREMDELSSLLIAASLAGDRDLAKQIWDLIEVVVTGQAMPHLTRRRWPSQVCTEFTIRIALASALAMAGWLDEAHIMARDLLVSEVTRSLRGEERDFLFDDASQRLLDGGLIDIAIQAACRIGRSDIRNPRLRTIADKCAEFDAKLNALVCMMDPERDIALIELFGNVSNQDDFRQAIPVIETILTDARKLSALTVLGKQQLGLGSLDSAVLVWDLALRVASRALNAVPGGLANWVSPIDALIRAGQMDLAEGFFVDLLRRVSASARDFTDDLQWPILQITGLLAAEDPMRAAKMERRLVGTPEWLFFFSAAIRSSALERDSDLTEELLMRATHVLDDPVGKYASVALEVIVGGLLDAGFDEAAMSLYLAYSVGEWPECTNLISWLATHNRIEEALDMVRGYEFGWDGPFGSYLAGLAKELAGTGHVNEARYLIEVASDCLSRAQIHVALVEHHLAQGEPEVALQHSQEAMREITEVTSDDDRFECLVDLAQAWLQAKDVTQARAIWSKGVRATDDLRSEALSYDVGRMAWLHFVAGEDAFANELLQSLPSASAVSVLARRSMALEREGRRLEARRFASRARVMAMSPECTSAYARVDAGRALLATGQAEQASRLLMTAWSMSGLPFSGWDVWLKLDPAGPATLLGALTDRSAGSVTRV